MGLSGPLLCSLISINPGIFRCGLDKTLKPCINLIKKVLEGDGRYTNKEQINDQLFRILTKFRRIVHMNSRLEANIPYLESCGVAGSQLSSMLLARARVVYMQNDILGELVSRALHTKFPLGSRMLVYAIFCLSCMSIKALNRRFKVLTKFGFSMDELASMFRKSPSAFGLSEGILRFKVDFFLRNLKIKKSVLVQYPILLAYDVEARIRPRYKVLELLKSRRLLREDSCFASAMFLSNQKFLENYILWFENEAEELLLAYNGKLLHASRTIE